MAKVGTGEGPAIIFCGHLDTVGMAGIEASDYTAFCHGLITTVSKTVRLEWSGKTNCLPRLECVARFREASTEGHRGDDMPQTPLGTLLILYLP